MFWRVSSEQKAKSKAGRASAEPAVEVRGGRTSDASRAASQLRQEARDISSLATYPSIVGVMKNAEFWEIGRPTGSNGTTFAQPQHSTRFVCLASCTFGAWRPPQTPTS